MPVVNASFPVQLYLYGFGIIEKITFMILLYLPWTSTSFYHLTKSFSVEVKIACNEVRGLVLLLFCQSFHRVDQRPAVELS